MVLRRMFGSSVVLGLALTAQLAPAGGYEWSFEVDDNANTKSNP